MIPSARARPATWAVGAPTTMPSTAIIIGAGPAGLTAAHELATGGGPRPIVLEAANHVGGLSATIRRGDDRIDLGGHRFFSKSARVMRWWLERLPLQAGVSEDAPLLTYQRQQARLELPPGPRPDPELDDRVMLLRPRKSRIYHRGHFFEYPLSLSPATVWRLGLWRTGRVGLSYGWSRLFPVRPEETLEALVINRFGRELYRTFFRDYTEKVWGVPCSEISADWGRQRIKGLSISRALAGALRSLLGIRGEVETSLIEQFLYPKHGPGQLWEVTAEEVVAAGGELHFGQRVVALEADGERVTAVRSVDAEGREHRHEADVVFSTMPMRELVAGFEGPLPDAAREVACGLAYRDFMTVGLRLDRWSERTRGPLDDNWIYIQEPGVKVGRVQIFNNWSPWMTADASKPWIGLEYFLNETDDLWRQDDAATIALAAGELERLGLADPGAASDGMVIRSRKAYPAYFGSYPRFGELRAALDRYPNLLLIGRNGMHRYNNQDHSMLAALTAVELWRAGDPSRDALWAVNAEEDYHEA